MAKKAATTETKKPAAKKAPAKKAAAKKSEEDKPVLIRKKSLSPEEQLTLDNYKNQCADSKKMHGF